MNKGMASSSNKDFHCCRTSEFNLKLRKYFQNGMFCFKCLVFFFSEAVSNLILVNRDVQ